MSVPGLGCAAWVAVTGLDCELTAQMAPDSLQALLRASGDRSEADGVPTGVTLCECPGAFPCSHVMAVSGCWCGAAA